jgi:hypothetical protein
MKKAWLHFKTITKHRHKVIQHCFKAGIPLQGLLHDISKYSPAEFFVGAKHYKGNRSPNEGEREEYGYSTAWMHHKGRNKHHYEYWTDYSLETRVISPVKMPFRYLVEMFCDRVAASKIYMKDKYTDRSPLEYFLKSKDKRIIHPETAREIEDLLTMLAEQGEERTFAHIRELVKSNKGKKNTERT